VHSEVLQKWVTIRGSGSGSPAVLSITQDEEDWLDVSDYADAVFWIDVREVSSTPAATPVILYLETAPFKDESLFTSAAPPTYLTASAGPVVTGTAAGAVSAALAPAALSVAPLGRWLRWRIATTTAASGVWDATFRIRVLRSRTRRFSPTLLPGCQLWLRSDLGIPSNATTAIATWGDQSGNGNTATSTPNSTPYSTTGGANGLPYLNGGGTDYLTGSLASFGSGPSHTLFAVVEYPSTIGSVMGAFSATVGGTQDTSFEQWANTTPNRVGRTSSDPAGTNADAVATSGLFGGTVAILSTTANASTSSLYINGSSVATAAISGFTPGSPTAYAVFARSGSGTNPLNGAGYEFIVYNRVLSAAELTVVHRYLGGRYGISVP
jgi:hypothetical protein